MRNVFKSLIAVFSIILTLALVACGGKGSNAKMYKVTWEVPQEATVKVMDYDKLPDEFEAGKTLIFEVSVSDNFKLKSVKANGRRVAPRGKRYNVIMKKDTIIKVETAKAVESLEVTSNPTKLTYFAGEAVETEGMVVKAKYKDGSVVELQKGMDGYQVSPSVFEGGEDRFDIIFGDARVSVMLDAVVEYKVEINPNGGKLSEAYIESLRAMNLHNFNVNEAGMLSFSYFNNLANPVKLPEAKDIEYLDHTFIGWSENIEINNDTKASKQISANWQAELVTVNKIEMRLENGVPYLVVAGNFRLADEVQLYLYEGNVDKGVKGDIYTNTADKYSPMEAKFDLTKLTTYDEEGALEAKWMDVRFTAAVDGKEESMEVYIGEGANVEYDLNQKVQTINYTYSFAQYNNYIKVYYNTNNYTYSLGYEEADGNEYIVISGTTSKAFFGKKIAISWWFDQQEAPITTANIGADGAFKVMINVNDFPTLRQGWAHVTIFNENIEEPEFGSFQTNLLISQCLTNLEKVELNGTNIHRAAKFVAKNGVSYYLGCENEGLMLFAVNENQELNYTDFKLEIVDGKIYYVVCGNYKEYTKEELQFQFNVDENGNLNGNWGARVVEDTVFDSIVIDEAANTFVAKFSITDRILQSFLDSGKDNTGYIIHLGTPGHVGDVKTGTDDKTLYIMNGVKYSLKRDGSTFDMAGLVLAKTDLADSQYDASKLGFTGAKILNVDGRAVMTITGTAEGFTAESFNRIGLQKLGGDWYTNIMDGAKITIVDGVLTITIDCTDIEANNKYMTKLDTIFGEMQDLKLSEALEAQSITIGDKTYTISCKAGSTAFEDYYGLLGLEIIQK